MYPEIRVIIGGRILETTSDLLAPINIPIVVPKEQNTMKIIAVGQNVVFKWRLYAPDRDSTNTKPKTNTGSRISSAYIAALKL
jgi:hypothetical protein